jgi:uncharacterized protein (DUF2235 family)
MAKRIVVCFDGTWNKPGENGDETDVETNVCRIYESLLETSPLDGWKQISWYDRGVGTRFFERLRGGALGRGLDTNIKQGYAYLSTVYDDGDQIFVFGFSRGAYTGRSLVGLIRKCGLLRKNVLPVVDLETRGRDEIEDMLDDLIEETIIDQAYDIYRKRDDKADTDEAERFRRENGREVGIKFLGVWDTVGALGVPLLAFEGFNNRKYEFHDTKLSKIVENAYHAVAIDEHRDLYDVALWEPEEPVNAPRKLEQRWFVGAHSDVGGGYKDRWLSDASLRWMQERAEEAGLGNEPAKRPTLTDENFCGPLTDSYTKFAGPLYRKVHPRHYRAIGRSRYGNEVIDHSVRRRVELIESYRPPNLD